MKEWFALKNKLKEMGVVSIEFESDRFHIYDGRKFLVASHGKNLTLVNRDSQLYPYQVQFENDGVIFLIICDLQEIKGYFPELVPQVKKDDYNANG